MLDDFVTKISQYNSDKNNLEKELAAFKIKDLEQSEYYLSKISNEKAENTSRIQKLENEISEIKENLPKIIMDMEIKLQKVSSVKYHIIE